MTAIATQFCLKGHKIVFFHQVTSFTFMSPMEANSDGKLMTAWWGHWKCRVYFSPNHDCLKERGIFCYVLKSFHKSNQTLGYSSPRFLCDVTRDYPIKYVKLQFNSMFLRKMNSVQNFKSQMRLKTSIPTYIIRAIVLYKQFYLQLIAQYLVVLLHVSATKCSHPQGATVFDNIRSVLCNLAVVDCKLYI